MRLALVLAALTCGCTALGQAPKVPTVVDGISYDVQRVGDEIRVSPTQTISFSRTITGFRMGAITAAEQVTGCKVIPASVSGTNPILGAVAC